MKIGTRAPMIRRSLGEEAENLAMLIAKASRKRSSPDVKMPSIKPRKLCNKAERQPENL